MLETRTGDVAELERAGAAVGEAVGDAVDVGSRRLAERWEDTRTRMRTRARDAAQATRRAARATDSWVQDHPWPAAGIAAFVGVVLGALACRRTG
jgi:ElaB/YqjD/DUF883 family membrane-anchored ribosome-binding protein